MDRKSPRQGSKAALIVSLSLFFLASCYLMVGYASWAMIPVLAGMFLMGMLYEQECTNEDALKGYQPLPEHEKDKAFRLGYEVAQVMNLGGPLDPSAMNPGFPRPMGPKAVVDDPPNLHRHAHVDPY